MEKAESSVKIVSDTGLRRVFKVPEPCEGSRPGLNRVRLFALLLGCVALLLLAGCGMNTEMKLNGEFKGERIITCDELEDQNNLFTKFKVSEAADVLSQKCPPQMSFECKYTNDKKTKAVFVFHLKYDSLDDYKSKVKALIGREPSVQFTYKDPNEDLFKSGFSLTEDFESKDLLAWVKPALKEGLNVSKDVSSMTDTVKITMNDVTFDNDNFASAKIKINTISKYLLDSIEVRTVHGLEKDGKDYERKVTVKIPKKTVEALGKTNIQKFMENSSVDGANGKWKNADDGSGIYSVSLKGSAEEIGEFTARLFGGNSSFSYVSDGSLNTAFSETGVLYDKISFERFPCQSDGSCNATFNYVNTDGSQFDASKSTKSGGSSPKSGEGVTEDGKTMVLIYEKASAADITLYSSSVYSVAKVCVTTDISADDKVSQEIRIAYKVEEDDSGAQFAAKYFKNSLQGSGIDITVERFSSSHMQYAVVLTTPRGSAEKITKLLQKYIGAGNSLTVSGEDKFTLYNKRSVTVTVDLVDFIKPSGFTGEIMYGFKGTGEASSVSWTSPAGKGKNDVLMGKSQSEFEHPVSEHLFTITYQVRRLNLMFVLLIGALVVIACGVIIMLLSWLVLRKRKKREKEKMEAVMTMALVKLPDGTETMMEVTPEEAANAVVIAPKDDDGLDEDDDEPENMWLFTTAMRLFAAMASVLFFFNFVRINSERNSFDVLGIFDSDSGLSGLDLIIGKEISDRTFDGSYFNLVLIIIPIVIFLLLSLRSFLPKMLSNIVIICSSLFQAWYLLGLEDTISAKVDVLGVDGKRFFMEMAGAYNYSIVIYVMLFAGAVLLLLMDMGLDIRNILRRKQKI